MKVVIMAGGKGTRISSIASDIPKPMIEINGKPVLEHEISSLKSQGFADFVITVGHLSDVIISYFEDGHKFDVNIEYYIETEPLGNAGALFYLRDKLQEDFLLLNGDALFEFDANRFINHHKSHDGLATVFTHPNDHPYDSSLILADGNNCVTNWLTPDMPRPSWYKNRVNAGIHILSPELLEQAPSKKVVDLDRDILRPLAGTGKLFCYDSPEYVKDMGTPNRFAAVCRDFQSGICKSRSLLLPQKAIFLDRDGTINKYVGFLTDINQFELLPDAAEAIRLINQSGYLAIVVTNQPVVARGEVTYSELSDIHNKMETLLGKYGAFLDAIYYCPHHPDGGFEGEVPELKTDCDCRKPKPGMLLLASDDYNINLSQSWIIGDSENDVIAGRSAGCHTIQLNESISLLDAVKNILEGNTIEKSC